MNKFKVVLFGTNFSNSIVFYWVFKSILMYFVSELYTERQKKHHFFRKTLTKIHAIKIDNIWT